MEQLDFAVKKGEFVVLIGPSGCGKSTLLSLAAGLVKPETGEVLMDGERLDGPTLKTSVIFQHNSLFPWMTVEKNVRFGLKQAKPELSKKKPEGTFPESARTGGAFGSGEEISGRAFRRYAAADQPLPECWPWTAPCSFWTSPSQRLIPNEEGTSDSDHRALAERERERREKDRPLCDP